MEARNKHTRNSLSKSLLALFLSSSSLTGFLAPLRQQEVGAQEESPTSLELRLDRPLRWEHGRLMGSLTCTNRFSRPLFLTKLGPYFYIALDVSEDDAQNRDDVEWVNIIGQTADVKDLGTYSLGAGSGISTSFGIGPSVVVVNLQRQTSREIPVRGKLRIDVSYFKTEVDAKKYKESGTDGGQLGSTLQWVRIFAEIPCPETSCKSDCSRPPKGVHGEVRPIPPIPDLGSFSPEANSRGRALANELSRKFPPCSGNKSSLPKAVP